MGEERWFYRSAEEWSALAERLKQTPCPHCKLVGTLIRHGCLHGYDDGSPQRKTVRARRVFAATARHVAVAGGLSASGSPTRSDGSASPPAGCGGFSNAPPPAPSSLPAAPSTTNGATGPGTVNPKNNLAHCFCCKKNLNNIDLLITLGYDFRSAVAILERWLHQHLARLGKTNQPQTDPK